MYVEEDVNLGFKDVFIRPKRSTLKADPMLNCNATLPSNIPAFAGPASRLSQRT